MSLVSTEAALSRAEDRLGAGRVSNGHVRFHECPSCGPTDSRAFWIADNNGFAVCGCFKCGLKTKDALEILGLLDGREYTPSPNWKPPPVPSDEERRQHTARLLALAITSPRTEAVLAHAKSVLLWDPALLRRLVTGELDGRVVLSVWDDDNDLLGVTKYAIPGTPARERSATKLIAHGRRSLWPRPRDVPEGLHLPGVLLLVEGPSAAATALGCGFACLSYPSCSGISSEDAERVAHHFREALVLGDCDKQGRSGMDTTVLRLRAVGVKTTGIDIAVERDDGFDVGDFLRAANDDNPLAAGTRLAREIRGAL